MNDAIDAVFLAFGRRPGEAACASGYICEVAFLVVRVVMATSFAGTIACRRKTTRGQ